MKKDSWTGYFIVVKWLGSKAKATGWKTEKQFLWIKKKNNNFAKINHASLFSGSVKNFV